MVKHVHCQKLVKPAVSSEKAIEWIRSKAGQEAFAKVREEADKAARELENSDKAVSQLVRQKAMRR